MGIQHIDLQERKNCKTDLQSYNVSWFWRIPQEENCVQWAGRKRGREAGKISMLKSWKALRKRNSIRGMRSCPRTTKHGRTSNSKQGFPVWILDTRTVSRTGSVGRIFIRGNWSRAFSRYSGSKQGLHYRGVRFKCYLCHHLLDFGRCCLNFLKTLDF